MDFQDVQDEAMTSGRLMTLYQHAASSLLLAAHLKFDLCFREADILFRALCSFTHSRLPLNFPGSLYLHSSCCTTKVHLSSILESAGQSLYTLNITTL